MSPDDRPPTLAAQFGRHLQGVLHPPVLNPRIGLTGPDGLDPCDITRLQGVIDAQLQSSITQPREQAIDALFPITLFHQIRPIGNIKTHQIQTQINGMFPGSL